MTILTPTLELPIGHSSLAMQVADNPQLLEDLTEDQINELLDDWHFWARPEQLRPPGTEWRIWLLLTGRGWGKTLTGAHTVCELVDQGLAKRIALVGATASDVRDTMVDELRENSGILSVASSSNYPEYEKSNRRLVWPNGAVAHLFSAEEPRRLRGPQFELAWCDELAAWEPGQLSEAWSNLNFGLRHGLSQIIITTTPRNIGLIKELVKRKTTIVTRGSTFDNMHNLSQAYIEQVIDPYVGTRVGRQELDGEILDDNPDALFQLSIIDDTRVRAAPSEGYIRVEVAVDPIGSADGHECGIVVGGNYRIGSETHADLLADYSLHGKPADWAAQVLRAYDDFDADSIVVERNYGGDMVASTVRLYAQTINHEPVHIKEVNATRGKHIRAEPVSGLHQQRRLHHRGKFAKLEDQLVGTESGMSDDRFDAYVWLMLSLLGSTVHRRKPIDSNRIDSVLASSHRRRATTHMGSSIWRKQF